MKRFIAVFLAFMMMLAPAAELFGAFSLRAHADESEPEPSAPDVYSDEGFLAFPDDMRASVVTVGKDFFSDPSQQASETAEEINGIISDFEEFGLNTIIIETSYNGVSYYETDGQLFSNVSPLSMMIEAAVSHNFFIYITFDLNAALSGSGFSDIGERIDYLSYCVHRISDKYLIDGIILQDYYREKTEQSYRDYRESGSGIGYENWLLETNAYIFGLASRAIRATNSSMAVGISIDNAWQNSESDPSGSDTKDDFEALNDGFSDTRGYILDGLVDFMIVYCYGGLESVELKFESVVSWWNDVAGAAGIPMFIKHANSRISASDQSWDVAQILKQLEECADYSSYRGSVFESYEQLRSNEVSTDALVRYYAGQIDTNSLYRELKMVLPTKTDFTTYEPTVIFQGSFDYNFDVYFNGEPITLNEAGNFFFEEELKVGVNTFTFKNKSKTVRYRITRKVQILKSVEPREGSTMNVEGTTRIAVNAVAYKGSKLTATLNGETIRLSEEEIRSDDLDSNTNYIHFTGYFTAPEGIIGEEQDLGQIVVTGTYDEYSRETVTCARVIVNAVPEHAQAAQLVRVKNDNTLTYDYYTTDSIANPTSPRLPAGTIDVYVNTVTYNTTSEGVTQSINYYLTESGLRLRASDCELIDGYTVVDNTAMFNGSYSSGGDTVLSLKLNYQTPFTISYSPLSYDNPDRGSYLVERFNPDYVLITFDHVSNYAGYPSFAGDSLFSEGEWQYAYVNGEQKAQLKLRLRRSGAFMGYSSSYDGAGGLTITFNGYNQSLYGTTIVVDPGHGYNTSPNDIDPGAVGHVVEQKINLEIARKLTAALQSAGANVYMLPSDTTYISVYDRSEYARRYDPDIYIAVHCNSVENGEGVRGVEAYYFTPFSQPLAELVSSKMARYYERNVYGDGKNRDRGAKYNYFAVTLEQEFASILVECGFVTDYQEAMALNNSSHQSGLANAIVEAVSEYLARGR